MAVTILLKKRAVGGAAGAPTTLASAEPAYNEQDDTLYYGKGDNGSGVATSIIPISGKGAFVDKTTDQTIAGVKAFSSSPTVPTVTTGDNSTKVASTAFVQAAVGASGGSQSPNQVYAGPSTGSTAGTPAFRALVAADMPSIPSSLLSDKGAANGVATLDATGKVPTSQLPSTAIGALSYKGVLDASTAAYPASPAKGDYYVVSVAGTISGHAYAIGDWAAYDGVAWDYIDNQNKVSSVNGQTGIVSLSSDNVSEGTTNKYFTESKVLATVMTGLSTATNAAIVATESILVALGKLQAQINSRLVASNNLSDLTSAPTARTNLGLGDMATQSSSSVAITGGTMSGVAISGVSISGGVF
jgi:hypothetical protein